MDKQVLDALSRWPNVPDVYGWLSLSEQGHWLLHPGGAQRIRGEPIINPQIRRFIDRNYASDPDGRWFFQNGPQRVFVHLAAAPYILSTRGSPLPLRTHNGLDIGRIESWWLDDVGRLYAETEYGLGLIAGRDLFAVIDALVTSDQTPLTDLLETALEDELSHGCHESRLHVEFLAQHSSGGLPTGSPAPFYRCPAAQLPSLLGFQTAPSPDPSTAPT